MLLLLSQYMYSEEGKPIDKTQLGKVFLTSCFTSDWLPRYLIYCLFVFLCQKFFIFFFLMVPVAFYVRVYWNHLITCLVCFTMRLEVMVQMILPSAIALVLYDLNCYSAVLSFSCNTCMLKQALPINSSHDVFTWFVIIYLYKYITVYLLQ